MTNTAKTIKDAAKGSLLGACVGDAAGAVLEFMGGNPNLSQVNRAMTMPGGGMMGVASGQITDDGELTLCLAQALANSSTFPLEAIAQNYNRWINSDPFDVGLTTISSLGCPKTEQELKKKGYAGVMRAAAQNNCLSSKANGSLMRITPLGIWGYKFDDEQLGTFAQLDSQLSHPNKSCLQAVACYVIAIASLMRNLGDREQAFARAKQWANANANREVKGWLKDAQNNVNVPYHPHIGFIKIAFTHAFRHLWLGTNYVDAIAETLLGGGDTDTNACIVGGLIGAVYGAEGIPAMMQQPVLNCHTASGIPRPLFLHPNQIPDLVEGLIAV
ncbi:ADP-ribosylglycohydrolase family protein [Crocosphaera sp.]|uniref:ADP-ribosylglycohydrolase family protein n=1 Tax=Crocosphaera sp. TaxID=2729996 RepID=UPI003F260342|nr:ADP-ribosylglycohydrolase family protein [Crocosphaera sp.]